MKVDENKLDILMAELGFRARLAGTRAMRQAVLLYAQGKRLMTREIYPEIGRAMGCTAVAVECVMRYSVWAMWETGEYRVRHRYLGLWCPTVSECVRRLAQEVCSAD